jgi:hypothetical protein
VQATSESAPTRGADRARDGPAPNKFVKAGNDSGGGKTPLTPDTALPLLTHQEGR